MHFYLNKGVPRTLSFNSFYKLKQLTKFNRTEVKFVPQTFVCKQQQICRALSAEPWQKKGTTTGGEEQRQAAGNLQQTGARAALPEGANR
jgi:hypothetical protein